MILTTTPSVEGRTITEYKGVVFGEVVSGVNFIPAVNQIETHVFYQQRPMLKKMAAAGTVVESWGPLAEGLNGIFTNPVLTAIGRAHGKTAAQVALRFLTQQGIIVIPKSVHRDRMIQNLDTLGFNLTEEEMADIRSLDTGHNLEGWPSDALKYNPKSES